MKCQCGTDHESELEDAMGQNCDLYITLCPLLLDPLILKPMLEAKYKLKIVRPSEAVKIVESNK